MLARDGGVQAELLIPSRRSIPVAELAAGRIEDLHDDVGGALVGRAGDDVPFKGRK